MPPRHLTLEVFDTHHLGGDPGADLELAGGIVYLIKGSQEEVKTLGRGMS